MSNPARIGLIGEGASFIAVTLAGRLLGIVAILALAKRAAAADFGLFAYVQTAANLGVLVGLLNVPAILNVALAHRRRSRQAMENTVVLLLGMGGTILSMLVGAAILFHGGGDPLPGLPVRLLFAAFIAATAVQLICQAALFARGRHLYVAVTNLVVAAAYLVLVLLLRLDSLADILTAATLPAGFGAALFAGAALRAGIVGDRTAIARVLRRNRRRWLQLMVRYSGTTLIAGALFQYALWLIQRSIIAAGGPAENAAYAVGLQFSSVVIFIPAALGPVLVRDIHLRSGTGAKIRRVLHFFGLAGLCCLAGLGTFWALREPLLGFFPQSYAIDTPVIVISIVAGIFAFLKAPLSLYFQAGLDAVPDACGNLVAAVAIGVLVIATSWAATALGGSELRALAWAIQLVVLAGFFAATAGKERRGHA